MNDKDSTHRDPLEGLYPLRRCYSALGAWRTCRVERTSPYGVTEKAGMQHLGGFQWGSYPLFRLLFYRAGP